MSTFKVFINVQNPVDFQKGNNSAWQVMIVTSVMAKRKLLFFFAVLSSILGLNLLFVRFFTKGRIRQGEKMKM